MACAATCAISIGVSAQPRSTAADLAARTAELRSAVDGFRGWLARTVARLEDEPTVAVLLPRPRANRQTAARANGPAVAADVTTETDLESAPTPDRRIDVDDPYAEVAANDASHSQITAVASVLPTLTSRLDSDPYDSGETLRPAIAVGVTARTHQLTSPSVDAEDPYL